MTGSIAYYAILGGLVYFGAIFGDGLFYMPLKWITCRRNTLLSRSFSNSPAIAFWQRIVILGVVLAVFSAITVNFPYKAPILSFLSGITISFLQCSCGLLRGFIIVKNAGYTLTAAENRIRKLGYNPCKIRRKKNEIFRYQ